METTRISRERKTIEVMIQMYCHGNHKPSDSVETSADKPQPGKGSNLCDSCAGLLAYAMERIDKCPFLEDKPTCVKCPVHCYQPQKREEVRQVMRYSGPRMLLRHPYLAVMHLIDGKVAGKKSKAKGKR